jgi:hexulose-6-phosphate isomerase
MMQGRLSPMVSEKIQCFPFEFWKAEFHLAEALNIEALEWTLDHRDLMKNPFFRDERLISELKNYTKVTVPSVTYDAAMQMPLIISGKRQSEQVDLLIAVLEQARKLKVNTLVLPLVDGSSVTPENYGSYVDLLVEIATDHLDDQLQIAIESDFAPQQLSKFIGQISNDQVGINYDTGNSAALGYDFKTEMAYYKDKILNVHVKDRYLAGTTCQLGTATPDLYQRLRFIKHNVPKVNLIIQGARSKEGNDIGLAREYIHYVNGALSS